MKPLLRLAAEYPLLARSRRAQTEDGKWWVFDPFSRPLRPVRACGDSSASWANRAPEYVLYSARHSLSIDLELSNDISEPHCYCMSTAKRATLSYLDVPQAVGIAREGKFADFAPFATSWCARGVRLSLRKK